MIKSNLAITGQVLHENLLSLCRVHFNLRRGEVQQPINRSDYLQHICTAVFHYLHIIQHFKTYGSFCISLCYIWETKCLTWHVSDGAFEEYLPSLLSVILWEGQCPHTYLFNPFFWAFQFRWRPRLLSFCISLYQMCQENLFCLKTAGASSSEFDQIMSFCLTRAT